MRRNVWRFGAVVCLTLFSFATVSAADWTTFAGGNSRRGVGEAELKLPLELVWMHSVGAPQPAFEGPRAEPIEGISMRHRVLFDDAVHPVVADGRVFFGNPNDHNVYCRDGKTGKQLWSFWTEGPVRMAPTIVGNKVYVGSDDGFAYCLSAETGKLVWKSTPAPRDERLLARGRLISRWPVRTGVLVEDGVAYFGAGIFPHETVYLCAANAETGEIFWKNDHISQRDAGRDDFTPQGYLAISDDYLIAPCGRSLPAVFDRKTGEFLRKKGANWRGFDGVAGGWKVLLDGDQIYASGRQHFLSLDMNDLGRGHAWIPGTQMAVGDGKAYIANGTALISVDLAKYAPASVELRKLQMKIRDLLRSNAPPAIMKKKMDELTKAAGEHDGTGVIWSTPCTSDDSLILAGDTVFVGGDGEVAAYSRETGQRIWMRSARIEGAVRGLAATDNLLLVSTTSGQVLAYRSRIDSEDSQAVIVHSAVTSPISYSQDYLDPRYGAAIETVSSEYEARGGFCLVVGSERGRLAHLLGTHAGLAVVGIESDAAKCRETRERLTGGGSYGSSVTLLNCGIDKTPLPNFFANVVMSETQILTGTFPGDLADVARYVKPCGGMVILEGDHRDDLKRLYVLDEATVEYEDGWTVLTRGKLNGADDWTHQYGTAGNTASNRDDRIKGGLGVLWYGDPGPGKMINRHSGAHGPLSAGGRMFVQGADSIRAYDIYNGQFLWEHENPGAVRTGVFNNEDVTNVTANEEAVFAVVGDTCTEIDAVTGKIRREHEIPKPDDELTRVWGFIAHDQRRLYGTSTVQSELERHLKRRGLQVKKETDSIFAIDMETGEHLWQHKGDNILHQTIAIGDGKVCYIDSTLSPEEREAFIAQDKKRFEGLVGVAREKAEAELKRLDVRTVVAVDAATGDLLWRKAVDVTDCSRVGIGGGQLTVMYAHDRLVICGANANGHYWKQFLGGDFSRRRLVVLDANTGEKLWAKDANYRHRPIIAGHEIIAEPWAFDLETGQRKTRTHPITGEEVTWQFSRPGHHCGGTAATPNMLFFRSGFTGYYDLYQDTGTRHFAGHRIGCWVNAVPSGGLVVIPESSAGCVCTFSITSTVVLEPRADRSRGWGVYSTAGAKTPVRHLALNLGAPGDRRDESGTLWFAAPRPKIVGRLEFDLPLATEFHAGGRFVSGHEEAVEEEDELREPWQLASYASGLKKCVLSLRSAEDGEELYQVEMALVPPANIEGKKCRFDVRLQGRTIEEGLELEKTGCRSVFYYNIMVEKDLVIELAPRGDDSVAPGVATIEVREQL
jgi:outer membrane protein assembly factor BamB